MLSQQALATGLYEGLRLEYNTTGSLPDQIEHLNKE